MKKYLFILVSLTLCVSYLVADFGTPQDIFSGTDPKEIQIADMNGDNKNDIVFVDNGVIKIIYSKSEYSFGLTNNSAYMDGIDNSFMINSNAALKASDFTFSTWINFGAIVPTTGAPRIFSDGLDGSMEVYFKPGVAKIYFRIKYADLTIKEYVNSTDFIPSPNTWYHIAFAHSVTNAKVRLVIDGTNITVWNDSAKTLLPSTNDIYIGTSPKTNSFYFNGYIDEMSYFSKYLNELELAELYNNGTPSDLDEHSMKENIVSWWTMGDHTKDNFDALDSARILKDVVGKNNALPIDTQASDKVDNSGI
jgi:hypothetical protein